MTEQRDTAARIAQIRDDFIRFSGHAIASAGPLRMGGLTNPGALARVQYMEGQEGPTIFYDGRLPEDIQLWILEAAYQLMITGGPDLTWHEYLMDTGRGVVRQYRYFDMTPEWLAKQPR